MQLLKLMAELGTFMFKSSCIAFSPAFSDHTVLLGALEQTGEGFGSRGSYTDVWGFATTILHMATGQVPYSGFNLNQMLTAMIRQRPPAVPDSLPGWLQQLLSQCLSFNITARPSVQQLLQVS